MIFKKDLTNAIIGYIIDLTIKERGSNTMEKITLNNGKTIMIKETFGGWEATTEENCRAFVRNARDLMKFSNREFKDINEVKEYLMQL